MNQAHADMDESFKQGVENMNHESTSGWSLLRTDDDRRLARVWLTKVTRELEVVEVRKTLGSIRTCCIRAELDEEAGRITGEFETAYAVRLTSGKVVCGIAPTARSAACRTRRLLRHGHCQAAGVARPQHVN